MRRRVTPRCWTLPTPHDVTPWRHEDRQLWPLPRFTKPLSRSWHYSRGGDNPCAAVLMTQDAPLGFQTGCWRFSLRCFTYSFRGRNPMSSSRVEVQQLMWQNSDSARANQQCIYEKYIRDDSIPWIIATLWWGIRCFRLLPKKVNIRTGFKFNP
jgi:hypothetical protein